MTAAEVEAFVAAGHVRLDYCRMASEIIVDGDKVARGIPPRCAAKGAAERVTSSRF